MSIGKPFDRSWGMATIKQTGRKIAVAGATGRVGRHVVDVLEAGGNTVIAMSRSTGVDVVTGKGLEKALTGVECIVDASTGASPEQAAATAFFETATRNLQEAGTRAGVRRIVVVSIIGIDKLTVGYNVAKLAHEHAMRSGPIPVRILRAAQFHEFVGQLMEWGRQGDVCYVPNMRTQLVAARNVGEELAALALDPEPLPHDAPTLEIAGPRPENLLDMARLLARRRGEPSRVEQGNDPTNPDGELFASGVLLPGPTAKLVGPTFEEWLNALG
jgi:uncharacterized protein YbjT (DUF2867 family)